MKLVEGYLKIMQQYKYIYITNYVEISLISYITTSKFL